jgi:hypothetical protein
VPAGNIREPLCEDSILAVEWEEEGLGLGFGLDEYEP